MSCSQRLPVRGSCDPHRPGRTQPRHDRRSRHRDRGGKQPPRGPARSSPLAGLWPCHQARTRRATRPRRSCTRSCATTTGRSGPRRRSSARAKDCRVLSTTSSTRSCGVDGTPVGSRLPLHGLPRGATRGRAVGSVRPVADVACPSARRTLSITSGQRCRSDRGGSPCRRASATSSPGATTCAPPWPACCSARYSATCGRGLRRAGSGRPEAGHHRGPALRGRAQSERPHGPR